VINLNPLKKIVFVFLIFLAIGAYFSVQAVEVIRGILPENVSIVAFSPVDVFVAIATVVVAFALMFTLPVVLFEAIKFIKPALYEKEKKALFKFLPISIFLFLAGAGFGVYIMAFFGLRFFAAMAAEYGIQNLWSLSSLTESLAIIGIAFGLTFQMPLVLTFLVKQRLVKREELASARPLVLLGILILAAFLTPPDLMSQILMALPLYALFEGTLFYLHFVQPKEKKKPMKIVIPKNPPKEESKPEEAGKPEETQAKEDDKPKETTKPKEAEEK